jgi:8-oxo-dGTP pyrophosphatase MutT (NUDIX family)
MKVREDEIERDNGARGIYGVVEKYDSAIILPIENADVYLVDQFRYAIGRNSLEFPQGSLEKGGIDPAEIARDELQAETGLVAEKLDYLGEIYIACGYANQMTHAFLATGLSQGERRPDVEEHDLVVRKVCISKLQELIRDNEVKDAQTLAAWAFYQARRGVWRETA